MHIERIELDNYMRFTGHHRFHLEPTIYGVRAEWTGLPGRSNWAGKSSLLESIPLAMFGTYPAKKNVDSWITDGTDMGRVAVTFDSGITIEHKRFRGGETTVRLTAGGEVLARAGEARAQLEKMIGLNKDDFFATCFFRQREMNSVVSMQPGVFAQTVIGWLRLESLEALEDAAGEAEAEAASIVAEEDATRESALRELRETMGEHATVEALQNTVQSKVNVLLRLDSNYQQAQMQRKQARGALDVALIIEKDAVTAKEALDLRKEARELELQLEGKETALEAAVDAAEVALESARQNWRIADDELKRVRTAFNFDGICPVMLLGCPAKTTVVKQGKLLTTQRERAVLDCSAAKLAMQEADRALGQASKAVRDHEQQVSKVENNRTRAAMLDRRISKQPPGALSMAQAQKAFDDAGTRLENIATEREQTKAAIATGRALLHRLATTDDRTNAAKEAKLRGRVRRAAKLAQRLISQNAMGWIANEGNEMLASSGIDLSFQVRWAKETKGFEPICGACGRVFAGKGAKPCACGRARQPRMLDRPSLDMSNKSGGADDLVGMGVRLGASAWLRGSRGSSWACCIIDEPFGALDAANRDAVLSALLSSLRGRYGFEQAFVVAHHEEVMSAMPGTLRVVAGPGGSRVEVMS